MVGSKEVYKLINFQVGIITNVLSKSEDVTWVEVSIGDKTGRAVNYDRLTGDVLIDDEVILNTTAVDLALGTGGYHFIIHNNRHRTQKDSKKGHIMKLRYTPFQLRCLTAEEQESLFHEKISSFTNLEGNIFIVGTLHSMLAPLAATLKWLRPELNINYIMTDAGALPIQFSNTVRELKSKNIINKTITVGHSFGGDFECVNIYTGLITAKEILKSDITIITMGPGIVGTGTKYGFSGIEQGYIIDAINNLKGIPFAVPRISFQDKRDRHIGISHHTITTLSEIANTSARLVLPDLDNEKAIVISKQVNDNNLLSKHIVTYENGNCVIDALENFNLKVSTMGRTLKEDIEYFLSLGAVSKGIIDFLKYR